MKKYVSATFSFKGTEFRQKVPAIKGVRALTGMGLKESKEFVESLLNGPRNIPMRGRLSDEEEHRAKELLNEGEIDVVLIVPNNKIRNAIATEIQGMATYATISAQYDLARELVTILERYFPAGAMAKVDDDETE